MNHLDSDLNNVGMDDLEFKFHELFKRPVLQPFLVILVMMMLLQFSGQGAVTFYTAQIFKDASSSLEPTNCALLVGLTYFCSALLGLVLKNLVGRRLLILASQLGMAVSHLGLGLYFHLANCTSTTKDLVEAVTNQTVFVNEDQDAVLGPKSCQISWLPLPLIMGFTISFNLGLGSLTWVVATEVLPVRSRGWTHTLANLTSNLCWFVVTKTFRDLQDSLGHAAPFFLYGGVCLFGLVFIFIFLPETRGKTPEETAQNFLRPNRLPTVERSDVSKCVNKTTQNLTN